MSDEEDYMSDKFLLATTNVCSSLIYQRSRKRQLIFEEKQKAVMKKQKEDKQLRSGSINNDILQEALKKPIQTDNKGFQMLTKMGYTPGQALGKSSSPDLYKLRKPLNVEPISITLKADRHGLGHETAVRELKERRAQIRQRRLLNTTTAMDIEEFRKRATQRVEERSILIALRLKLSDDVQYSALHLMFALARTNKAAIESRHCQVTCENLDRESHIEVPEVTWFWCESHKESDEVEESDTVEDSNSNEDFTNKEKLWLLTGYLRTSYQFCYWCGIHYKDVRDLEDNCPGPTKDDH